MADASVDYQASSLLALNLKFHQSASTTSTPTTNVMTQSNVGDVACERNIIDITSYTEEDGYCGGVAPDFVGDMEDTSAAPVSLLENFGCTFDGKLLDSISITMTKGEKATASYAMHNHDTNPHDGGATPTGATRADALALGIADVSNFLPHEAGEPFFEWDGFGIPENYGVTVGVPATATASSATVTFSWGSHPDEIDNVGKHFVGKNLTAKCELSMDFTGVPAPLAAAADDAAIMALLDADFAANTSGMNGCITDSVDKQDSNSGADTFAFVAHAYVNISTV